MQTKLHVVVKNLVVAQFQVDKLRHRLTERISGYGSASNKKASTHIFKHYGKRYKVTIKVEENDRIISFLDSKLKNREDPDRKSIVTWNDYLGRIKYFTRWLYNCKIKRSKLALFLYSILFIVFIF